MFAIGDRVVAKYAPLRHDDSWDIGTVITCQTTSCRVHWLIADESYYEDASQLVKAAAADIDYAKRNHSEKTK